MMGWLGLLRQIIEYQATNAGSLDLCFTTRSCVGEALVKANNKGWEDPKAGCSICI